MKTPKPFYKKPLLWILIVIALLATPLAIKIFELNIHSPQAEPAPKEDVEVTNEDNDLPIGKETYSSNELNISFEYPKEWGAPEVDYEIGIDYEDNADMPNEKVAYELSFSNIGHILTANRENFGPIARGGYWGDLSGGLRENNISGWCFINNMLKEALECEVFTNKHGIRMIRHKDDVNYFEEGVITTQYHFHTPYGLYSGVTISPLIIAEKQDVDLGLIERIFEEMAQSIRFNN